MDLNCYLNMVPVMDDEKKKEFIDVFLMPQIKSLENLINIQTKQITGAKSSGSIFLKKDIYYYIDLYYKFNEIFKNNESLRPKKNVVAQKPVTKNDITMSIYKKSNITIQQKTYKINYNTKISNINFIGTINGAAANIIDILIFVDLINNPNFKIELTELKKIHKKIVIVLLYEQNNIPTFEDKTKDIKTFYFLHKENEIIDNETNKSQKDKLFEHLKISEFDIAGYLVLNKKIKIGDKIYDAFNPDRNVVNIDYIGNIVTGDVNSKIIIYFNFFDSGRFPANLTQMGFKFFKEKYSRKIIIIIILPINTTGELPKEYDGNKIFYFSYKIFENFIIDNVENQNSKKALIKYLNENNNSPNKQ